LFRLDPATYAVVGTPDTALANLEDVTYVSQLDSVLVAGFNGPLLVKNLNGTLSTIAYAPGSGSAVGGYDADFDPIDSRIIASAFNNGRFETSVAGAPFVPGASLPEPGHIEVDTVRNLVYVANGSGANLRVAAYNRTDVTNPGASPVAVRGLGATGITTNGGLAYNVKSNRIYAGTDSFSGPGPDKVVAINPDDFTNPAPVSVLVGLGVYALVTDDDRDRVYAVSRTAGQLNVLNYTTLTPVAGSPLNAGADPIFVAYDRAAARIVVLNSAGSLTVFNADTLQQIPGSPFSTFGAGDFHSVAVVP
jgi:hypothetical protein